MASGGGKSGGGSQGREGKTKSVKKKGGRGQDRDEDSDDDSRVTLGPAAARGKMADIEFMSTEELSEVLQGAEKFKDCPEELINEMATQLYRCLHPLPSKMLALMCSF